MYPGFAGGGVSMKLIHLGMLGAVAAGTVAMGMASAQAGTSAFSATAPTAGAGQTVIASNLPATAAIVGSYATGSGTLNYYTNTGGANNPGSTFTTGSNAGGYNLDSITVYVVDHHGGLTGTGGTVQVQLGTAASSGGNVTLSNTAGHFASLPAANGGGNYFTYTFATPISLAANTLYGYGLFTNVGFSGLGLTTSGGTTAQQLILENATGTSNTYNGTDATATVGNGADNAVFEAIGTPVGTAVPEPATLGLLGVGAVAMLRRRRKTA